MIYKILFILVEGNDDEELFKRIIKSKLENKYGAVRFYKYAQKTYKDRRKFIRNINLMNSEYINAEYIYVTDINHEQCFPSKKEKIQEKINNIDKNRIIVVIQEIEGWYIAGLCEESSNKLRITPFRDTNNLTKEQFYDLMPTQFDSVIDFRQEILKYFQIDIAKKKNKAFQYFFEKYDC